MIADQMVNEWLTPLTFLQETLALNLYLIRNNAIISQEIAVNGLFHSQITHNLNYQLIQVALPIEQPYYPDMRGGKQRLTIRFFQQLQPSQSPIPIHQDIPFELFCCIA